MGYEIVAFDPAPTLISSLAASASDRITAHVGSYDDMDALFADGERFAAAILGWGSFSHLRNRRARVETLRSFARLTDGPILVSFLGVKAAASPRLRRLRSVLPRRPERDPEDVFATTIGFYHPVDEAEVQSLAEASGLDVVRLSFDERDTNWPHVVFRNSTTL
jgi:hypothetical protein